MFSILVEFSVFGLSGSIMQLQPTSWRVHFKIILHVPSCTSAPYSELRWYFFLFWSSNVSATYTENRRKQTWNSKVVLVHLVKLKSKVWNELKLITTVIEGVGGVVKAVAVQEPIQTHYAAPAAAFKTWHLATGKMSENFGNLVKWQSECIQ